MDHDDLTDRLRALGEQPVPEATRHQHLNRMTATAPTVPPRRFGRVAVAAAAMVGFFAGSTGLAMAGALPDPAQDVAHDVLSTISVQVPAGTPGHRGSCVSTAAKIADPEAKAAEKAKCPKGGKPAGVAPGRSGEAPGRTKADKHADDPCRGKPPWAGRNDMTEAEKQAAKEQRAAECGRTLDADDPADAAEDAAEREREAAEEQREAAGEQRESAEEQQPQEQAPDPVLPEAPAADAEPQPAYPPAPDREADGVEPGSEAPVEPEG